MTRLSDIPKAAWPKYPKSPTEKIEDGRHTFDLVRGDATARRLKSEKGDKGVDNTPSSDVQSGFSVFNPVIPTINRRSSIMAKAKPAKTQDSATESNVGVNTENLTAGEKVTTEDGDTMTLNPVWDREETVQERKQREAKAKIAAKAEKKAEAEKAKAEREAAKIAKAAASEATKAERKAAADARRAALAALGEGRNYTGTMLALSAKVKEGVYVKSTTGQLRSTDALAEALDGVTPNGVIEVAKHVLGLEINPYQHLNVGQQSMNLRNKMRGGITKGTVKLEDIKAYIAEKGLDVSESIKAEKEAKVAKKAEAEKAAAEKKAAAAEKAAAEKAAETVEA